MRLRMQLWSRELHSTSWALHRPCLHDRHIHCPSCPLLPGSLTSARSLKIAYQDGVTAIGRRRWIGPSLTGNAGAAPGVMLCEPALSCHSLAGG